jgi:alpha-ketoglutarate-dependent taurine dioxygenase
MEWISERVVRAVREDVRQRGWSLATGLPFVRDRAPDLEFVLGFAARLGRPSERDGGIAAWPVTPVTGDPRATFSQRAGHAALHTDAAYRRDPERGVCLFAVRPAQDGGRSRLVAGKDVLHALPDALGRQLSRPDWEWRVPAPFQPGPPFRGAVLSRDGKVRWRADTLRPAGTGQERAAAEFAARVETLPAVVEIPLQEGDVLVLDNHRMLHGRTAFTDPCRLLVRVRLWDLP